MEQLITDIETYCEARGIVPPRLLKEAVGAQWGTWRRWKSRESSPTMNVADRLHAYMAANPPPPTPAALADGAA